LAIIPKGEPIMTYRTIREDYVEILGYIWWPSNILCSLRQSLSGYDLENILSEHVTGDIPPTPENLAERFTRESVENWLGTNAGDFSQVVDFHATAGAVDIAWSSEENELAYYDALGGE
jgi:hypothetical protein